MLSRLMERGATAQIDATALERALRDTVRGEVRFDPGSRALYATDSSNYRQVPLGVVIPRSVDDVVATVDACHRHGAPVLSRGGGTSLCGQCCNVAVVMDFSKYLNAILSIDAQEKTARVQPGVVLDALRDAARQYGLTFAPDPATHSHNTLGGMIGNNSCGPHSVMGGETVRNIIELDVLTYDGTRMTVGATDHARWAALSERSDRTGQIYRDLAALRDRYGAEIRRGMPRIPRRVSGYGLEGLLDEHDGNIAHTLVGSEGTCVVVLEARIRLVDDPPAKSLLVLGYPDVYAAGDHVPEVMTHEPIALEGMDDRLIGDMKALRMHPEDVALLPPGNGWLLVEFGGKDKADADGKAHRAMAALRTTDSPPSMKLFDDPPVEKLLWRVRESGLGATAHVPNRPITWEGWEDSAVPPERLGQYLRELRALLEKYGYGCDLYGHFGQGCVHTRIDFDLETAPGIAKWRAFLDEAAHLVVRLGGSISGEHGDGQSKAELLPIMYSDTLMQAFREFKRIWDPLGRMNPGKVVDAYRVDENLRLGTHYDPPAVPVHFHYGSDGGSFARATLRCVGVGECRKRDGTMCPSYKATGEEMHSTRGRAHLLFEMLQGDVLKDGWTSDAVHEALDLCLSCKGCKGECPVKVDMATYRAEFMSHYYERRPRPLAALVFGRVDRWARPASHMPGLANLLMGTPPFAGIGRALTGIAPQRQLPRFAPESFTQWFRRRPPTRGSGQRVLLWPDTFNNYFYPEVARDAVAALEHAGYAVDIPRVPLCCGRPLYEYGLLVHARRYFERVLAALEPDIRAGTPIVGLEPACVSAFTDELPALLPGNEQAKRLQSQVKLLADLVAARKDDFPFGRLQGKALVHLHCHQRAVLGVDSERDVLDRLGLAIDVPDSGCCGMAGSFGFMRDKYDVSMRCAERVLLPAIRAAAASTLIVADGFSCREQIRQATGSTPLHLAQLLRMAADTTAQAAARRSEGGTGR